MAFRHVYPLLIPLTLLTLTHSTATTLPPETTALLAIKLSLYDPLSSLSGWDPSTPSAPCDWRGITCTNTSHVISLRLPNLSLSGPLSDRISHLRYLRRISLRNNRLNGSIPTAISTLTSLRVVYLQGNDFSGSLSLLSLSNLSSLDVLVLANNSLSGSLPFSLPNRLRYLDLGFNSFSGQIPATLPPTLEVVDLSYNQISGSIPGSIGGLQYLKYLWLDNNQLMGPIPAAISNCSKLVHFSADGNLLDGVLPAGLPELSEIEVISLSNNRLSGTIPAAVFCNVSRGLVNPNLRIVRLGFNGFTELGSVDVNNVRNCVSVLRVLELQGNGIKGVVPDWLMDVSTLVNLDLSGNLLSGSVPKKIGNLVNLEVLKLGNNSFEGSLPYEIMNCTSLQVLDLGGNRFSGDLPVFLGGMSALRELNLSGNGFNGSIPLSFNNITSLESLDLSDNSLSGLFPEELTGLSNLTTLSLSGNRFYGQLPRSVGELTQLSVLNLSGNGFDGKIPESLGNLYKLKTLDLSKQNLSGELPSEFSGLPYLQVVALQENNLTGDVPEGFSSLLGLTYLNLTSNSFSGHIPPTFGYLDSLVVLSLSKNNISDVIPPELGNCSNLHVLELGSNSLGGDIPPDFSRLSHLSRLDLSENKLSGEIPQQLSNCSALGSLLLNGNNLSGSIPVSLSHLTNLTSLDLSQNNLVGIIPENLTAIPTLSYLNLSKNNLQGKIPERLGARFNDPSLYADNHNLCGKPLDRRCAYVYKSYKSRMLWLLVIAIGGICILALCCCFYIYGVLRWRRTLKERATTKDKKRSPARASSVTASTGRGSSTDSGGPKLIMFNNKITLAETIEATRNFDEENVLSRTKYGLVFKATYNDGMVLSIRRLPDGSLDETVFKKEAEALGKLKHPNLTVLRGYYAGAPNLRLLVYDYMPNGNLATLLQEASHQDGHVLNWPMRHLIALGVARGLAMLHASQMVHGDLKPQKVLFDADFEAHLSDFGLDKLIVSTPTEPSSSTTSVGTVGYVSPEAGVTGVVTKESDVYSFGIVLLELLTGKRPVMFTTQDEDIVKWVKKQLQKGQITELLEPGLLELDPESSEWEEFLLGIKVGLLCTAPDPLDRPTMGDIVFMLEGCRVGPDIPSSADPTSHHSPA